jgi:hypothetical protein
MQQGPVLVCVSADLSGESDGLGVPAFNRFVMQSAFNKVSPLNCRSSIHSALISISRPEKLLNKGLSQGQRENCSSLRAHISLLPLDLFFTAMIYRMTRSSSVLAQSLLKCGEKPESLTHLDKRSSPFGRLSQKAAKGYFKATLWLLDLQQVHDEINREKILALITVVLAVAPLLVAGGPRLRTRA